MKTLCFGLFVMVCEPVGPQLVNDSFCLVYNQVVVEKGDGAIQAPLGAKKRILANELAYRKRCKKAGE